MGSQTKKKLQGRLNYEKKLKKKLENVEKNKENTVNVEEPEQILPNNPTEHIFIDGLICGICREGRIKKYWIKNAIWTNHTEKW